MNLKINRENIYVKVCIEVMDIWFILESIKC